MSGYAKKDGICHECQNNCTCEYDAEGNLNKCTGCIQGYKNITNDAGNIACEKIVGCHAKCGTCLIANDEGMCASCATGFTARAIYNVDDISIITCDENAKSPMSSGSIAGIIIGVIAALLIVGGLVFYFINKNKRVHNPVAHNVDAELEVSTT